MEKNIYITGPGLVNTSFRHEDNIPKDIKFKAFFNEEDITDKLEYDYSDDGFIYASIKPGSEYINKIISFTYTKNNFFVPREGEDFISFFDRIAKAYTDLLKDYSPSIILDANQVRLGFTDKILWDITSSTRFLKENEGPFLTNFLTYLFVEKGTTFNLDKTSDFIRSTNEVAFIFYSKRFEKKLIIKYLENEEKEEPIPGAMINFSKFQVFFYNLGQKTKLLGWL